MNWLSAFAVFAFVAFLVWVWRTRRASIKGDKSRNKHFAELAKKLGLAVVTDDYFIQLEGTYQGHPAVIYPHHFEGPGFVTLIYLETGKAAIDRNWIEPNESLGRALVDSKQNRKFNFETSGSALNYVLENLERWKSTYPYIAVTLPHRFSYSPLQQKAMANWKNFVVFLALDAGRRPGAEQMGKALQDAVSIAALL